MNDKFTDRFAFLYDVFFSSKWKKNKKNWWFGCCSQFGSVIGKTASHRFLCDFAVFAGFFAGLRYPVQKIVPTVLSGCSVIAVGPTGLWAGRPRGSLSSPPLTLGSRSGIKCNIYIKNTKKCYYIVVRCGSLVALGCVVTVAMQLWPGDAARAGARGERGEGGGAWSVLPGRMVALVWVDAL